MPVYSRVALIEAAVQLQTSVSGCLEGMSDDLDQTNWIYSAGCSSGDNEPLTVLRLDRWTRIDHHCYCHLQIYMWVSTLDFGTSHIRT